MSLFLSSCNCCLRYPITERIICDKYIESSIPGCRTTKGGLTNEVYVMICKGVYNSADVQGAEFMKKALL